MLITFIYLYHSIYHMISNYHCRFTQNLKTSSKIPMSVGKVCFAQKFIYYAGITFDAIRICDRA